MKMKGKTKTQKGITLVALIITIVVLLILAVVAITAVQNDSIIEYANNAISGYKGAQTDENTQLGNYEDFINTYKPEENGGLGGGDDPVEYAKVADSGDIVYETNTTLQDDYGNLVKVPAGFKIASDSATAVTGGVVIEDATYTNTIGSQFVWIPTGNIKTSLTDTVGTNITLARYVFDITIDMSTGELGGTGTTTTENTYTSAETELRDPVITAMSAAMGLENPYFKEGKISGIAVDANGNDTKGYALNITNFINSAKPISQGGNGGYYIGRYEARTNSETARTSANDTLTGMTTVKTNAVYNYVTQLQATEKSQSMYTANSNFTSDLVNSFAWDTAIAFIQAFGDNDYSKQTSLNDSLETKGTNNLADTTKQDVVCNIWDMANNCSEWSTETDSDSTKMCTRRGGQYNNQFYGCTGLRDGDTILVSDAPVAFRPILYIAQ